MALSSFKCTWLAISVFTATRFSLVAQTGAESKVIVGPPTNWVAPLSFTRLASNMAGGPEEQHYLLLDRQWNAAESTRFNHVVRQIANYAGIKNGATISVGFDPSYQSLTFHWLRIWRGTNCLNRLSRDKIRLLHQEPDLANLLFYGTQSATLILNDVRVGDIIDYAYSICGDNPVFDGKFYASVDVQLPMPVERLCTRLIWPINRPLYASNHLCSAKAQVLRRRDSIEYIWDFKKVPALHTEDSLPKWFDPEPAVQLSELPTWGAVNQWALHLFEDTSAPSAELQQMIDKWRQIGRMEDRVLTVLQFLQDEVRYFGVEMGANSHKPSSPSLVFERRFGDCKDKTMLFVSILRALSIEAYPVLVNYRLGRAIEDLRPSAHAFDHVIAFVQFEGREFWLDPTAERQIGSLKNYRPPDFERGLVINPRTTALSSIPKAVDSSKTSVSEFFRLRGKTQSADLKVVTVAEGVDAENLRRDFATTAREEIEKQYLHFYSRSYPGIRTTQPIIFEDDPQRNRIEMTEFYTIENMWTKEDDGWTYGCSFYPTILSSRFNKPVDKQRTQPLGIRFPSHYVQHTEISLPTLWPSSKHDKSISDPAFLFERHIRNWGDRIEMDFEYQSFTNSVSADRVADYLRRLDDASQLLGYGLTWQ